MVYGYHLIFSAYGFWLPNDPRGSWSTYVGSLALYHAGGAATKTDVRRSVAHTRHDRDKRLAVKESLQRPAVKFDAAQRQVVGDGIGFYVRKSGLEVWACTVMPDHVHLAFGRFRLLAEQVSAKLKESATRHLCDAGVHPFQTTAGRPRMCWGKGEWVVYLAEEDVPRTVRYIENNPVKEGLPPQAWDFVRRPPMEDPPV